MPNTLFYGDNYQVLRDLPRASPPTSPQPASAPPKGNRGS